MLFTIVFMQISTHADALHFAHEFAAKPFDWLLFSIGNALRAADLADALKDYGVYVPQITPNSWFTCCLLIAYRLIIDLLFLSYALLTVKRIGEWITDAVSSFVTSVVEVHMIYLVCCVAFGVCWAVVALWWRPWLLTDQILWPVDNALRVIDVFDAMQIFGIRFDSVPHGPVEITLGIVFRLLVAVALAAPLATLQERSEKYFQSKGLTPTQKKTAAAPRRSDQAEAKTDLRFAACAIIAFAIGVAVASKLSKSTHERLADVAVSQQVEQAHRILRRLGNQLRRLTRCTRFTKSRSTRT